MTLISEEARSAVGKSETFGPTKISRREIQKYSAATQQRVERFRDGDEAPPMFLFGVVRPILEAGELEDDGLAVDRLIPELPLKRVMAGGTKMRLHRPVRAGDTIVATRTLVDLYEKQGRSGPLLFAVTEIRASTQDGELLSVEKQTRILR